MNHFKVTSCLHIPCLVFSTLRHDLLLLSFLFNRTPPLLVIGRQMLKSPEKKNEVHQLNKRAGIKLMILMILPRSLSMVPFSLKCSIIHISIFLPWEWNALVYQAKLISFCPLNAVHKHFKPLAQNFLVSFPSGYVLLQSTGSTVVQC